MAATRTWPTTYSVMMMRRAWLLMVLLASCAREPLEVPGEMYASTLAGMFAEKPVMVMNDYQGKRVHLVGTVDRINRFDSTVHAGGLALTVGTDTAWRAHELRPGDQIRATCTIRDSEFTLRADDCNVTARTRSH